MTGGGHAEKGAWHILTGEYPPCPGGVSDYTRLVAAGLARAGAEVHVWTTPAEGADAGPVDPGVIVHREAGRWSRADLTTLGTGLDAFASPRRLLVQYTPNAWGYKGVNLGFIRWLRRRARAGDHVTAMIHEAAYPWRLRDKPTRLVLAAVHRLMLRGLLRACERVHYSCERVGRQTATHAPAGLPLTWMPVPSNIPEVDDPGGVAALRRVLAPAGEAIVGNFATYGRELMPSLARALPPLVLGHPGRVLVLIGRNGPGFADRLLRENLGLKGRVIATGSLSSEDLSRYLQACDLIVQPYGDGVSTRRTTVMAALDHSRPIVTNRGVNTETMWAESGALALAGNLDAAMVAEVDRLLADPEARGRLGAAARDVYRRCFAVEWTVEALLQPDQP